MTFNIPPEMAALPNWMLWHLTVIPNQLKGRKIPYRGDRKKGFAKVTASSTDCTSWTTLATAQATLAAYPNDYSGLGFAFDGGTLAGIDIDNCVTDGVLNSFARNVVDRVSGYTELSPSGKGIHVICNADVTGVSEKSKIEIYKTGRYFTFTGDVFEGRARIEPSKQDLSPWLKGHAPMAKADYDALLVKPPLNLEPAEIRYLLSKTDNFDEPTWRGAICAIKHETNGSEAGWGMARVFSQQNGYDKYDEDYLLAVWNRVDNHHPNALTMGGIRKVIQDKEKASQPQMPVRAPATGATDDNPRPTMSAIAFAASAGREEWLIKNVIPKAEVGMIVGPSGVGKTFVAISLAATMSCDLTNFEDFAFPTWCGHRVKPGNVLYLFSESPGGGAKRLAGYAKHFESTPYKLTENLRVDVHQMDLMKFSDVEAIYTSSLFDQVDSSTIAIFIDTLSAANSGKENEATDMNVLVNHARWLSDKTGAIVVIVHHTGKDESKGARGSNALYAGANLAIELQTGSGGTNTIVVTKQKEGEIIAPVPYRLNVVKLGVDEDGDERTTCTVNYDVGMPVAEVRKNAGRPAKSVLSILMTELVERFSEIAELEGGELDGPGASKVQLGLSDFVTNVIEDRKDRGLTEKRDTRRDTIVRAITATSKGLKSVGKKWVQLNL